MNDKVISDKITKVITQEIISILPKILDKTFCKNFISLINSKTHLCTEKEWDENKDNFCSNILDTILYEDAVLQIFKKYDISAALYYAILDKHLSISRTLKKHINNIVKNVASMNHLFAHYYDQIDKIFEKPNEVLNALQESVKKSITWDDCKQIILQSISKYFRSLSTKFEDIRNEVDISLAAQLFIEKSNFKKKYNIISKDIFRYMREKHIIFDFIDFIRKFIELYNKEKPFFNDNLEKDIVRYDPYEFYLRKDNIGDIQYSSRSAIHFSEDRTSPIILINDEVYTSNQIDAHHDMSLEEFKKTHNLPQDANLQVSAIGIGDNAADVTSDYKIYNIAVGSNFNKVVLLEYYYGDINEIKYTFLKNGFKKVYYNKDNSEIPNAYERIAKKHLYQLCKYGNK